MSQATQTTPIGAPVEEPAVPVSRPRFMFAFVVLYMLFSCLTSRRASA